MPTVPPGETGAGPSRVDQHVWRARQTIAVYYTGDQGTGPGLTSGNETVPPPHLAYPDAAFLDPGGAFAASGNPLIPSQLWWRPAAIAQAEPPRPDPGSAFAAFSNPLVSSQLDIIPPAVVQVAPPRPDPGAVLFHRPRISITAQLVRVPPLIVQAEPPRPQPGSIATGYRHPPLITAQVKWFRPILVQAEPPRPEGGRWIEASNQTLAVQQIPPRRRHHFYTMVNPPSIEPEPASVVLLPPRFLARSQLYRVPPRIVQAEPPRPEPGRAVSFTSRPLNAVQFGRTQITLVRAEPPRPDAGGATVAASRRFIPAQLVPTRPVLVQAEPPRPDSGRWIAAFSRAFAASQVPPGRPVLVRSEPPRPDAGSVQFVARHVLVTAQLTGTRPTVVPAEPPRPGQGVVIAAASRRFIAAQLAWRAPTIVQVESPAPEAGRSFRASNPRFNAQNAFRTYPTVIQPDASFRIPDSGRAFIAGPWQMVLVVGHAPHPDPYHATWIDDPLHPEASLATEDVLTRKIAVHGGSGGVASNLILGGLGGPLLITGGLGTGSSDTGTAPYPPDPWSATDWPTGTLAAWEANPTTIQWLPPDPEPDPESLVGDVILVELPDLSGWTAYAVPGTDARPALDWSTVVQWALPKATSPDPTQATIIE